MPYAIKGGYLVHIPGGKVFKTIEDLWQAVDKEIAKKKNEETCEG